MSIGDPMTATIPPVGTSGTGYATAINAFLTEVKSLLEAHIPMASLLIDTLDMQNNPIQNVQYLGLYEQTTVPADVGTLQNYGGDLYWVNAAGAVQITLDDALNSAAIGGITGDYGAGNPAQWRFDDADQSFYGYDDYANAKWAHVRARDFGIYGAYGGTTRITLTGTAGSSYTVTLPSAPPASQSLMQMSTSGVVSASNTITGPLTSSDFLFSSTRVKAFSAAHGNSALTLDTSQNYFVHGTSTNKIFFDLGMESDDVITAWKAYINKTSTSGTVTATLYKMNMSNGTETQVGTPQTNSANNPGYITLTEDLSGSPQVVSSEYSYYIKITPSGTTGDYTYGCSVNYDRTA